MSSNNFVKVASSGSTVEAEQIVQLLKLNGISAYRQSEIMDIYTGNAMMGEDIMVAKQDQNTALKILKDFQPIKTNTSGYSRDFSKGQMIVGWVVLALILLFIIVPFILL